jgi:L-threonylcarbamoyladenylate synthase
MLLSRRSAAFLIQTRSSNRPQFAQRCLFASTMSSSSAIITDENTTTKAVQAKIVSTDQLKECGERLRQGNLVAFPTETVYGLGCHALDEDAILKVFAAKERPLTDPLIVHVSTFDDASPLWDNPNDAALQCLTQTFWPGPLTLVAKAAAHVPPLLMAHTGYVACRSPQHAMAQELLKVSQLPIAAPSANKFGHVSPTRAEHVFDDLKYEDVWIVESNEVCSVGVESTVAKMTVDDDKIGVITVLRQGAISALQLEQCLAQAGLSDQYRVELQTKRATPDHVANVAPGQTIRHYSPNIPSFLVTTKCATAALSDDELHLLKTVIVIDFGGILAKWQPHALAYRDLSVSGKSEEAAQAVFDTLRWAEQVAEGRQILFPHLDDESEDALVLAVKDRLTRAASGVTIDTLGSK